MVRKITTPVIKKGYKLYFGWKIYDQNKKWALYICCPMCAVDLRAWLNGKCHLLYPWFEGN
jgi:hypothetical protein